MKQRRAVLLGGAVILMAATLVSISPAAGLDTRRTGAPDNRGFPTHYTDDAGLALQLCEDGTARCLQATRGDLLPPDGEALYWAAAATLPSRRGELAVEFALEGAFGEQAEPVVFDRLRIRGHLNRAGRYVLRHPYGAKRFRATSPREQRNVNVTVDVDCSLRRGGACPGRISTWLRSTDPTAGHLGGGEAATTVVGGRVRNRLVLLTRRGRVIGRTNRFAILGKVAPGPAAAFSRNVVPFGNTARPKQKTVRIRNLGTRALDLGRMRVAGAETFRIRRGSSTCTRATTLARGRACRLVVRYRPGQRRFSAGRLVIRANTRVGRHRIPLRARTQAEFSSRRRVHFTPRRVGDASHTRRVIVQNTGVVPLRVHGVSLRGRHPRSFVRRSGQGPRCEAGTRLRPGAVCAVYVAFTPKTFGTKRAFLRFRTNVPDGAQRIRLNGRGR